MEGTAPHADGRSSWRVLGHWNLPVSTPGPGYQYQSCFTDEKAGLQKAESQKPQGEDAEKPGFKCRQPDAGVCT